MPHWCGIMFCYRRSAYSAVVCKFRVLHRSRLFISMTDDNERLSIVHFNGDSSFHRVGNYAFLSLCVLTLHVATWSMVLGPCLGHGSCHGLG